MSAVRPAGEVASGPAGLTLAPSTVQGPTRRASWWAPVASLLVPGAGQLLLGQQRSVAYLVAEGYFLLQASNARNDFTKERIEYRDLASSVARRPFSTTPPPAPWEYYELLESGLESGLFDRVPGGAIDPEIDENTYNGFQWRKARDVYWNDPSVEPPRTSKAYQDALAFYVRTAVGDDFRWSWRDARDRWDLYRQTVARSNRSYQRALNMASVVGANHLVSMIDAYVTVRIRRYGGAGVAGVRLDGVESAVLPVGDPRDGRRLVRTSVRFVPAR